VLIFATMSVISVALIFSKQGMWWWWNVHGKLSLNSNLSSLTSRWRKRLLPYPKDCFPIHFFRKLPSFTNDVFEFVKSCPVYECRTLVPMRGKQKRMCFPEICLERDFSCPACFRILVVVFNFRFAGSTNPLSFPSFSSSISKPSLHISFNIS
jgi:hypothetical protein